MKDCTLVSILILLILIVGSTAFTPFWRDADDDGNRVSNTENIRKSQLGNNDL